MIKCQRCKKQYIGETKRTLRERSTEHRQATNNPSHANDSAAVPTHFSPGGYFGQFFLGMCRWPLRTPTPL